MVTITTGVAFLRWQLLSAVLMFLTSVLSACFRKSDCIGLAVISSGLRLVFACWSAIGLLGITLVNMSAIWKNIEAVVADVTSHTPSDWPMVLN